MVRAARPGQRFIRLSRIDPSVGLESEARRIYQEVVSEWRTFVRTIIVPQYDRPPALVVDADGQQLQWLIDQKRSDIDRRIVYQTQGLRRWVTRYGMWHTGRMARSVLSATGVDVAPYMVLGDIRAELEAAISRNVSLITGVSDDIRRRVSDVVFNAFALRKTRAELVRDLARAMGISQRSARNIARDQSEKLNSALNNIRQVQLGFNSYIWRTRRDHKVRKDHREREGRVFRWDKPPPDGHPGHPINCRCGAEAYMEV